MTKPRTSIHRELFGIIGHVPDAAKILRQWNAAFRRLGIDASMDLYPTTAANLPERLSEMFHFDRRGYLVGADLARTIIPLLDQVEPMVRRRPSPAISSEGRGVGFVWNDKGVLHGIRAYEPTSLLLHLKRSSSTASRGRGNNRSSRLATTANNSHQG